MKTVVALASLGVGTMSILAAVGLAADRVAGWGWFLLVGVMLFGMATSLYHAIPGRSLDTEKRPLSNDRDFWDD